MLAAHIGVDGIGDSANPAGVQDAFHGNFVDSELCGQGSSRGFSASIIKTVASLGKVNIRE